MDLIDPSPYVWIDEYQPYHTVKPMVDTHVYDTYEDTGMERFLTENEDLEASGQEERGFEGRP